MLLKKQTVWLLTMLSLVVVLSVYYVTSPDQGGKNLADVDVEETTDEQTDEQTNEQTDEQKEPATETDPDSAVITNASGDEMFEELRLQLNDERSKIKEDWETIVGSTDLPAEERSAAKDQINQLDAIAKKEETLEKLIRAMNYEDVLVRADGNDVRVTVKVKELSRKAANEIIREVKNEIGNLELVTVEFTAPK